MTLGDVTASREYARQYVGMFLIPQYNRPMYTAPTVHQSLGNQKVSLILHGKGPCGLVV
jgi:hypothetical protein